MELRTGQTIEVPCTLRPGAFSEERLVDIDTLDGPISGFVRVDDLHLRTLHDGAIRAIVRQVLGNRVEVRFHGSFFTTNGIATIDSGKILQLT